MDILFTILLQGLCYALVALGVYISYKILDFPDLSVDGTFPLGAVITVMLVNSGVNFFLAMIVAMILGALAGSFTGILHVKFGISNLLSGILTMTGLLSINLVIGTVGGVVKTIINYDRESITLFKNAFMDIFGSDNANYGKLIILVVVVVLFKIIIDLFLKTKCGFMMRSIGDNEQLCASMGKNAGNYKILGLALANAMVALAGSVYSQWMRYYDYTSGTGMVVIALASVIIGCSLFKKVGFVKGTTSVIIGALIYTACLNLIIAMGLPTNYLKLVMALLFTIILICNSSKVKAKIARFKYLHKEKKRSKAISDKVDNKQQGE